LEAREVLNGLSQRFVAETYEDLLQRTVDPSGLAHWTGRLDQGASRIEVVLGIENSLEYRTIQVQNLYKTLLRRPADAGGLKDHVALLAAGATVEEVKANILGSAEYFQSRGRGTEAGFLAALYEDALDRAVDPAGAAAFGAALAGGTPRDAVAQQVLLSPEGCESFVNNLYRRYLYREAEDFGLGVWSGALHSGARHEEIVAGVVGSEEYLQLVSRVDTVLDWNETLLQAVRVDRTAPPRAARNMALVHAAVYDAVNAVTQTHSVYKVAAVAAPGTSPEAAAAVAAHRVLTNLYPAQMALFDAELALSLSAVPDGNAKVDGVALGRTVADGILTLRSNDGAGATVPYTPGTAPGDWRPTLPGFLPALLPQWPGVTPFALTSGGQFLPPPPPALDSAAYAADFDDVKQLGRRDSVSRTADQTEIALFWADGPGTVTPPGHWNVIAQHEAVRRGLTLAENARLFALLNLAEADASINSWNAKYVYDLWRPVTAIREAAADGNDLTSPDATWAPLLVTPPFPTYTSGHSTFSGAASGILTSFFGDDVAFADGSDDLPGVYRSFDSFAAAANEAGRSRIYGGIHYEFDNVAGLAAGRAIAAHVFENYLK
jgi:membrane-associated phospholipid phosphatase